MGTSGTHSGKQRTISVGILSAPRVEFCFGRDYVATEHDGLVVIDGEAREEWYFTADVMSASVNPSGAEGSFFTLKNVKIGKGFHWERYQDQCFPGDLRLIAREGCVVAINVVGIEDYLQCVIASEMSPTAGFEFLKAHAVISRSWLLAQLDKRDEVREGYSSVVCDTPDELIRWQDREDHEWFDFCADDHCQRYQGIPQGNAAMIRKTNRVIEATWGQVLWYDGRVCDARFSKCCGGALEEFKYCWEDKQVPYLKNARDYKTQETIDLRGETAARRWILTHPRAFCNTRSKRLLGQVLKDYDSETKDFYRWEVKYTAEDLRQIILERTGEDYGEIRDLIPLERGVSGRICRLKIVGSKKTRIIGKELEIRRTLSRSHLYSSAFVVERDFSTRPGGLGRNDTGVIPSEVEGSLPAGFILCGAGWGHGVGLCQIGAAAMGARGYDYRAILQHYYPNSSLKNIY
ncbi:MAG: SpoIID/LytB domain-containing protein [Bacteroidales bacterium]|nr:SpoIID/LytB domain-containing protein [Bacteroidales bacterium]